MVTPVSSGQAAACWLAVAGRFAYTTNAGSGSIGRFAVAHDGTLSLTGTTVRGRRPQPLDDAVSHDDNYLYVLLNGTHQMSGTGSATTEASLRSRRSRAAGARSDPGLLTPPVLRGCRAERGNLVPAGHHPMRGSRLPHHHYGGSLANQHALVYPFPGE